MQTNRILRYALIAVGLVDGLLFLVGLHTSGMLLAPGLLALFLGVTDFGRQCPLLLSLRHLSSRWKSKKHDFPSL